MLMAAFLIATLLLLIIGIVATLRRPILSETQRSKITRFPSVASDNHFGAELLMPLGDDAHCHRPADHPAGISAAHPVDHGSFDSGHASFEAGHGSCDVGGHH
jgi:hypothetical protein